MIQLTLAQATTVLGNSTLYQLHICSAVAIGLRIYTLDRKNKRQKVCISNLQQALTLKIKNVQKGLQAMWNHFNTALKPWQYYFADIPVYSVPESVWNLVKRKFLGKTGSA